MTSEEKQRRNQEYRALAERAGVPAEYLDDIRVKKSKSGLTHIYFGGVGKPLGPGHAHYILTKKGELAYKRNPFTPRGAQNFTSPRHFRELHKKVYRRRTMRTEDEEGE